MTDWLRLSRFAMAGLMATSLHVAVALAGTAQLGLHPGIANGVAFMLANTLSFMLSTVWAFRAEVTLRTWRRFVAVSLAGATISVVMATVVSAAGGDDLLGISLVVATVPMVSYFAHRHYTYG